jgi:hypothetical protein
MVLLAGMGMPENLWSKRTRILRYPSRGARYLQSQRNCSSEINIPCQLSGENARDFARVFLQIALIDILPL